MKLDSSGGSGASVGAAVGAAVESAATGAAVAAAAVCLPASAAVAEAECAAFTDACETGALAPFGMLGVCRTRSERRDAAREMLTLPLGSQIQAERRHGQPEKYRNANGIMHHVSAEE